jgi:hypothetical protein
MKWKHTGESSTIDFVATARVNLGFFCRGQGLADFGNMEGVNVLNNGR